MTKSNATSKKFSDPKTMEEWIRAQQTEMPALDYLATLKNSQAVAKLTDVTSKKALRLLESCIWPLEAQVNELRAKGFASDEIAGKLFRLGDECCLFPNMNADTLDRWDRI